MKILFVNPPNTTSLHVAEPGKYVEENIGRQFFPLPRIPFEVMAVLKDINEEKDILLLDFEWYKNSSLSKEELVDLVAQQNPDLILTTLIAQASTDSLDWLTTKIKKKLPNCTIILGGQAIKYFQEKIFDFCPNIDFAIAGFARENLIELISCIRTGKKDFKDISGLICKEDNNILTNKPSNYEPQELSLKYLYGRYKSLIEEVVNFVDSKGAWVMGTIEFSKGCPFSCNFCAAKSKYLEKNIEGVMEEIKFLYNLGVHKFYFTDLTFGVNLDSRKKILEILRNFKIKNKDFGFRCVTRADLITTDFVNYLLSAGCYEVGIGIECNDKSVLYSMNKKIPASKNIEALEILGKSGISFKLFLIEGYEGSNALSSKRTFELLNYLETRGYNYFIQPALNRDILPSQKRFKEKEKKGIIQRGNLNQLDFRHDCRKEGWDTERTIRSICLLMLAYPSTELGKENRSIELQKRNILDIPFFNDLGFETAISFIKGQNVESNIITDLRKDTVHLIDGVYTTQEIKNKLIKLYPELEKGIIEKEINFLIEKLREKGLIDSFGNPNLNKQELNQKNNLAFTRNKNMLLFWNGFNNRYIYAPKNKEAIKIKTCFYKDIPEEVFEFLIFSKGINSINEVSKKLHLLFNNKKGFRTQEEAEKTTNQICSTCKQYGFCY